MSIRQGRKFDDPHSRRQILYFIRFHGIDVNEIGWKVPFYDEEDGEYELMDANSLTQEYINENFANFNEFFYRKLVDGARILSSPNIMEVIVSPADCRINVFKSITSAQELWIKGSSFSLKALLKNDEMADYYENGSMIICRLAPQDYHRFHHTGTFFMSI